MLSDFTGAAQVYITCGYTDILKGVDGLAALVKRQVLHADETTLPVLREPRKSAHTDSYMWLYRTGIRATMPCRRSICYRGMFS